MAMRRVPIGSTRSLTTLRKPEPGGIRWPPQQSAPAEGRPKCIQNIRSFVIQGVTGHAIAQATTMNKTVILAFGAATTATALLLNAYASSHREAPSITSTPKLDATDFYAFNSYEAGRSNYVTFIANYLPLQDAYGGPNYFALEPDALYEIHIDNTGDAVEDLTFQFRFSNEFRNISLPIGPTTGQKTNSVPVI